jgi:hypothetical protein
MKTMLKIAAAVACAALGGCVMQKTGMINDQGNTVACNNVGIGDIGVIVSLVAHHACVQNAKAAGYHVIGEVPPAPGSTPVTPQADNSFKPATS